MENKISCEEMDPDTIIVRFIPFKDTTQEYVRSKLLATNSNELTESLERFKGSSLDILEEIFSCDGNVITTEKGYYVAHFSKDVSSTVILCSDVSEDRGDTLDKFLRNDPILRTRIKTNIKLNEKESIIEIIDNIVITNNRYHICLFRKEVESDFINAD